MVLNFSPGNDDQDESKDDDSDFSFSDVTDLDNYASGGPSSIPPSQQGMMESPYGQDSPLGTQPAVSLIIIYHSDFISRLNVEGEYTERVRE